MTVPAGGRRDFRAGFWRLADPKISLASFASLWLGGAMAARDGAMHWGWLAVTVVGIVALEVAKNASGDVFDYDSGTDLAVGDDDRSPFSGGKRVLVDGLLTRTETWGIALAGYGVALATGAVVVLMREPGVLGIGIIGLACAFFYHAPPIRLSYRGLGELAVTCCYGPLITAGTYLVQRGTAPAHVVLAGIPLGLLIGAFLIANEFPDCRADQASGKRTLVVRLGRQRATLLFAGVVSAAFVILALLPLFGVPRRALLGAVAILPALRAIHRIRWSPAVTRELIPAQADTLVAFLLYAVGAGVGALLS